MQTPQQPAIGQMSMQAIQQTIGALTFNNCVLQGQLAEQYQRHEAVVAERDSLKAENEALKKERDSLKAENEAPKKERDARSTQECGAYVLEGPAREYPIYGIPPDA